MDLPPFSTPEPQLLGMVTSCQASGYHHGIQTGMQALSKTYCCPWAAANLLTDGPTKSPDQCSQFAATTRLSSYLDRGAGGDDARVIHSVAVIDVIWQRRALLCLRWQGDGGQGILGGEVHISAVAKGLDGVS